MRNKVLATMMAVVMCFVSIPFVKPQQAEAWGTTTVYMYHRECLGTIWIGNTSHIVWDVGFAKDSRTKFETWTTYGYTEDTLFGSNNRIQNMTLYSNQSLSTSILNNSSYFNYGYCNK